MKSSRKCCQNLYLNTHKCRWIHLLENLVIIWSLFNKLFQRITANLKINSLPIINNWFFRENNWDKNWVNCKNYSRMKSIWLNCKRYWRKSSLISFRKNVKVVKLFSCPAKMLISPWNLALKHHSTILIKNNSKILAMITVVEKELSNPYTIKNFWLENQEKFSRRFSSQIVQ